MRSCVSIRSCLRVRAHWDRDEYGGRCGSWPSRRQGTQGRSRTIGANEPLGAYLGEHVVRLLSCRHDGGAAVLSRACRRLCGARVVRCGDVGGDLCEFSLTTSARRGGSGSLDDWRHLRLPGRVRGFSAQLARV